MADVLQDCSIILKLMHCTMHGVLRHILAKQFAVTYRSEIEGMMAILVRGDAMSKEDVAKAFDQTEMAKTTRGSLGYSCRSHGRFTGDSQNDIPLVNGATSQMNMISDCSLWTSGIQHAS